jgi:hypothetical protein
MFTIMGMCSQFRGVFVNCPECGELMELVDEDPCLGKMWDCSTCKIEYIKAGPGNAFDRTGWRHYG